MFGDKGHAAMAEFRERFGEDAPMAMMSGSEEAIIALLRGCIEEGSTDPIERRYPPGVET